ncbi:Putative Rho GTPase activation protein [Septoria linicola]|uniref:Rho GTPase activation protein n=1 Tax=Septoria linicola TaxID=215465 RepID=A0A9Q9AI07_9PEZI|nr:putative Rho GTPase activation protein [Septoria linicola]USW49759.1 Putative Rho GTPase activation protein [Septoria linicola]
MDSPSTYPESPMEQEDIVYPCKGCGEILEEGKAFELAGNRWHIDCFRCNTCGTLLDSDANLLLLGDGSLICNNCTYSCSACNNKIEDLAILTGDQAFCSGCFRCRNCKRKIENLRYARTSQGIFCMSCHESLMARRRKKARTPKQAAAGAQPGHDKALPSLPPGVAPQSAFTPEGETPPETYSENQTPQTEVPGQRHAAARTRGTSNANYKRDVSPLSDDLRRDGPTLPASTYGEGRPSNVSSSNDDDDSERGFLPMAFDPTPIQAPPQSQAPIARKQLPRASDELSPPPAQQKENQPPRDYFGGNGRLSAKPSSREPSQEHRPGTGNASSRSVSTERETDRDRSASQSKPSPHILYQEKGRNRKRDTSGSNTPVNSSATASPVATAPPERVGTKPQPHPLATDQKSLSNQASPQDGFRLGDVPVSKRADSRKNSRTGNISPAVISPVERNSRDGDPGKPVSPISVASQNSGINPFDDPKRKEAPIPGVTPVPPRHADRGLPLRGDSLSTAAAKSKQSTPGPPTPTSNAVQVPSVHKRDISASSVPGSFVDAQSTIPRENSRSRPEPPPRASFDVVPPPRSATRPSAPSKSVANDDFIAPRHAPPPPPPAERHRHNDSISTLQSEDRDMQLSPALRSAGLPKYSLDGGFSMDDEMGRILRGENASQTGHAGSSSPSMLRRVSNAVKHGRSFSDRAPTQGGSSPRNGSLGTPGATPSITSPTGIDGVENVRASLRRAQLHIAELETEKLKLKEKLESSGDIKAVNTELREKRSTMAFLDTQREMIVRELEIMTDHLSKVKDTNQPLDFSALKTNILRDFADSLQKLKDTMGSQIEDLMHKRNELTDEIGNLIQMKDKGFQEYESLSSKNAQLASHNNELIRSIQGMYQDNRAPNGTPGTNGLGIYNGNAKDASSAEVRNLNPVITDTSMPNLLQDPDGEPATILTAPQVVNIRKGAQPKKFNWRRGGEKVAGKVTKGIKGAFVGNEPTHGKGQYTIGMPYNQSQNGQAMPGSDQSSINSKQTLTDDKAYNFFNQKNGNVKAGMHLKNNSSANLAAVDGSVLFGSELTARCEHEGRVVPGIVLTCIHEVEKRGIDVEGIYRKSGGAGQVKQVQQGFEKDSGFDISDDDLDIHAVTSALKQYFRKLPTPLITYDVYDSLLEAGQIQDKEKQIAALRFSIESLPDAHRDCLMYLFQHLAKIVTFESKNLMTPLNLAVVFAPTIMRPLSIEREMSDMQVQRAAVQALLDNQRSVFEEE